MTTLLKGEELTLSIVEECQKAAMNSFRKYGQYIDVSELASFLETEIWIELSNKDEKFHDIRIIRRLIKFRTVDYIREESRFNNQTPMSASVHEDNGVSTVHKFSIEEEYGSRSNMQLSDQVVLSEHIKGFRATLTDRQNQILELVTAGYGTNQICEMLNISINTPANTMKKIRELALSYGL